MLHLTIGAARRRRSPQVRKGRVTQNGSDRDVLQIGCGYWAKVCCKLTETSVKQ
jgi:hypothetical protein